MHIYTLMNALAFQTLADPTRLRIVEALRTSGECPVNDLVVGVGIDQSGVSRHLRILRDAGFVHVRPEGARRLYSLTPRPFRELDVWLSRYRILWEARLEKFGEELERRQRTRGAHGTEGAS
jgi:DNA-binding transcriptional ArsR family regulator